MSPRRLFVTLICVCWSAAGARAGEAKPLEFQVTFDRAVSDKPFTGRVFVLLSKNTVTDLIAGVSWFAPEPMFAVDVKDWKPGEPLAVTDKALAYPLKLSELPAREYSVQAVMDFNRGGQSFSAAEGNAYGKAVRLQLDPKASGPVKLTIDQVYHERPFKEADRVRQVDMESKLLSRFHGRPVRMRAGVVLPKSFAENPNTRYPVIYEIPGFSGSHFTASYYTGRTSVDGTEMLYVVLDSRCTWGHHVFADSANNGPWGQALCEELIPHIERTFRGIGTPGARFVTGHSSGGWSSLWLQVRYPDFFGGVWSTAPDPVDFRDFQQINIYRPATNMFTDEKGNTRPVARTASKSAAMLYPNFSAMEEVMGHGGQLQSFEAVFGDRGPDGRPRRLWDRKTGTIDAEVARSWERYDIRLVLERNWKQLAPKLRGKIHVYMGGADTFYLEGATQLLKESLARLGSDAVVEIFPGKNHGTLMTAELRQRIAREMAEQFRKNAEAAPQKKAG
jgi:S-formylglutathione hydrolase FrmB